MSISLPLHKQFHPDGAQADAEARPLEPAPGEAVERPRSSLSLRVGDLAKRTGKTVRALHLYDELGLLVPAERTSGGYRLYTRDSELRVRWIDKLQQMGFSLTDIKQIVRDVEQSKSAPRAMQRVQDLYREKLAETREQLRRLHALESELTASLAYLVTCDTCDTEELLGACISCARHHDCEHKTPDLVAGFRAH
jgi:MerR family transcriptional regulator, copper efflux regulator